jgi:hypothetical protein
MEPSPEELERQRNIDIAIGLLSKNARDFAVVHTQIDGSMSMRASNSTYALGACYKFKLYIESKEAIENED